MKGKVILITGSTDGIGKQTAIELAKLGGTVIIHGRGKARAYLAAGEVCKESGSENVDVVTSDLSLLSGARALAETIQKRYDRLDVLINNAGVFMKENKTTADGFETTFAVNYLSPFLLTNLLLDLLKKTGTPTAKSRIVTVSSVAHQRATLDWNNLNGEKHFDGFNAYAVTKLAGILFTYELAERLQGSNVTANCLHPGVVTTKLLQAGFGTPGSDVAAGAETTVYLASSSEVENASGKYFVKKQAGPSSPSSNDIALRKKLWEYSEQKTGLV